MCLSPSDVLSNVLLGICIFGRIVLTSLITSRDIPRLNMRSEDLRSQLQYANADTNYGPRLHAASLE